MLIGVAQFSRINRNTVFKHLSSCPSNYSLFLQGTLTDICAQLGEVCTICKEKFDNNDNEELYLMFSLTETTSTVDVLLSLGNTHLVKLSKFDNVREFFAKIKMKCDACKLKIKIEKNITGTLTSEPGPQVLTRLSSVKAKLKREPAIKSENVTFHESKIVISPVATQREANENVTGSYALPNSPEVVPKNAQGFLALKQEIATPCPIPNTQELKAYVSEDSNDGHASTRLNEQNSAELQNEETSSVLPEPELKTVNDVMNANISTDFCPVIITIHPHMGEEVIDESVVDLETSSFIPHNAVIQTKEIAPELPTSETKKLSSDTQNNAVKKRPDKVKTLKNIVNKGLIKRKKVYTADRKTNYCKMCKKAVQTNRTLCHARLHSNIYAFQCGFCPYQAHHKYCMERHQRVYSHYFVDISEEPDYQTNLKELKKECFPNLAGKFDSK